MKKQWKDLKKGMQLFRDRIEDLYDEKRIAYFEILEVTGEEEVSRFDNETEKELTRTSVYVYGDYPETTETIAKEWNAGISSPDSIWLTDRGWTTNGWHAVNFLTKEEMMRRVVRYAFHDFDGV